MYGMNESTNFDARNVAKAKNRPWPTYKRLIGYVLQYKVRFAISVVLALIVALSFGAIIIGAYHVIRVILDDATKVDPEIQATAANLVERADWLREHVGWAPENLDQWLFDVVAAMRADPMQALLWLSIFIVIVSLISGLARFFQEYLSASIATFVTIRLGEEVYENVIRMPLRFFERRTTGEIIARMTNDVFMAGRGLSAVFMKLFREPFKAAVALGFALSISPSLTLLALCVLPPIAYVFIRIGRSVRKRVRRSLEKIAVLQTLLKESFTGIMIVKAFQMEEYSTGRVKREYRRLLRQGLKLMKADAAIGPATEFVMILGVIVFILISGYMVVRGSLLTTDLFALYMALFAMLDPIRKLTGVYNAVQSSVASAQRAFEFIDIRPDLTDAPDAIDIPPIRDALRFEGVSFAYETDAPVLNGVTFEVRKGEMVAVVGFSGAGKSTLAKLVPRFYDVDGGSISIDGVDVRKATLKSLRKQISLVTQESLLFNETVRANIAAGNAEYAPERVAAAAQAAHAEEFIAKLPQTYESVISEAGGSLSGGQRQRLAIARALVKDPAILILDEATSSLDSESEQAIQKAIEEFIVGRTTIVIAHRLSTIQRANRILVLDEGRIVEQGTHQELLDRGGIYCRLYEVQFASQNARNEAECEAQQS